MLIPNMGIKDAQIRGLSDALFPKVRQRVLAVLFGRPEQSFYVNEIVRLARSGSGGVQRELESLAASGIAKVNHQGNQKHYQANPQSPIYAELRGIIAKTSGMTEKLQSALAPLSAQIAWAFLYGSAATGQLHSGSDIDLMIVADGLALETTYTALADAENDLGRKINPTVYTRQEFIRRKRVGNAFVKKVLAGRHETLIGNADAAS